MPNPVQRIHTKGGSMLVDTKLTSDGFHAIRDDVAKGRLSGIPECCIQFFVQVWDPLFKSQGKAAEWRSKYFADVEGTSHPWEYLPCPHCKATGNVAEVIAHVPPVYLQAWNLVPVLTNIMWGE